MKKLYDYILEQHAKFEEDKEKNKILEKKRKKADSRSRMANSFAKQNSGERSSTTSQE